MRRKIMSRIPALVTLLILCLIVWLYVDGWFDVSFIARGAASDDTTPPHTADTTINPSPQDSTPSSDHVSGDAVTGEVTDTAGTPGSTAPEFIELPDAGAFAGTHTLSYAEWVTGDDWVLAEIEAENISTPKIFTSHKAIKNEVSYASPGGSAMYEVIYTPVPVDVPAVTLYMGYIIVETGTDVVNIYTSDGSPLGSYNASELTPALCRDSEGRPLFTYAGAYYYLDSDEHKFTLSDYDPGLSNRGALFDYVPDYGTPKEEGRKFLSRRRIVETQVPVEDMENAFYVTETAKYSYALANAKGKTLTSYKYNAAYEFSESLAAVVDKDDHLFYITRTGETAIKTSQTYEDITLERNVIEFFMEPLSNGPESIGFYFFEHGLTRARVLSLDRDRYKRGRIYVLTDEDVVINTDGERFYIPFGYDIEAYSSGMILLHGESGYGYMNYTGTWVVDPDLDSAEPFYEGLAVVKRDGKTALIDTTGNTVIPFGQFSYISNASSGVIAAYNGEWHIFNKMERGAAQDQLPAE